MSGTCAPDLAVWHHGIERISGRIALHAFARDSFQANFGDNGKERRVNTGGSGKAGRVWKFDQSIKSVTLREWD